MLLALACDCMLTGFDNVCTCCVCCQLWHIIFWLAASSRKHSVKPRVTMLNQHCPSSRQLCRSPVHTSNVVEYYKLNDFFDKVECCFDIVAIVGNNVAGFGNNVVGFGNSVE